MKLGKRKKKARRRKRKRKVIKTNKRENRKFPEKDFKTKKEGVMDGAKGNLP